MSRAAKMDVVTALMAIWRAPCKLFNTFFVFMAMLSAQISGRVAGGREEGLWGGVGGWPSGAVNCAGVLIQRWYAGLMLQQRRRYVRGGDFCD